MANSTTKIDLELGIKSNKQDFDNVKRDIDQLLDKLLNKKMSAVDPKTKKELGEQLKIVENISTSYEKAFDSKTGQINVSQLNQEMKKLNVTVEQFHSVAKRAGNDGAAAYNGWASSILDANVQLKQSNQLLDKMAITLKNTVRYGISSSIFNTFTNSVQKAYNYTKNLDTSLNDIRIVSGQSADQMERLAINANRAAKELGKTTLDYTKAATIYYQQGLPSEEVEKRTEVTLKAANITGQNAQEVSEQLTAVWNGYRVTGEELELYVDKLAAVAAHSASNLEELSTGMSKVASAAKEMGVSVDQLNAQMSTIISVTRQAPESVGTALRTIYARIADINAGLDDETSLGNYSGKMAQFGINVLKADGSLRQMGEVIEEIGGKWQDLDTAQRVALARTMAGTRQYNNLLTLFNNWDKYTRALEISADAAGTLQEQQDIYMESTEAHLKQLQATAEETYSELFDQESARDFIDLVTTGLSTINKYLNGLNSGALGGVLGQLGALGANLFSKQIASGISTGLANKRAEANNADILQKQSEILDRGYLPTQGETQNQWTAKSNYIDNRKNLLSAKQGLGVDEYQKLVEKSKELAKIDSEIADKIAKWDGLEEDLNKKSEEYKTQLEEIDKLTQKQTEQKGNLSKEDTKRLAALKEETKEIQNLKNQLGELQASDDSGKIYEYKEGQQQIKDAVAQGQEQQRIQDIVRGTTALLGTWNNLWTGINIATDENLTAWEKFQGLIGVAGTQVMMMLTSYSSLKQMLPAIIMQFKLMNVEKGKELTLDMAENAVREKGILGVLGMIAAKIKDIAVTKIRTVQTAIATAAQNGENIALAIFKALLGDVSGLGFLAAAAIVALTAAAVAGVAALIDANTGLNYYNNQIEKAAEKTKKAKEEFDELKGTFDAYKEARNSIDDLTIGTLEYYDAMVKANEEAQKLIDKLGLIAGVDYTVSSGGLIQISDEKLKELQFKEQQRVYRANAIEQQKRYEKAEYIRQQKGKQLQKDVTKYEEDNGLREKKSPVQEQNRLTKESQKTMGEKLPLPKSNVTETKTDITEYEVPAKAAYSQAEAEALTLKRMLADQIIRGYTSELDISTYDAMDSAGKKIMQDAVNKQKEANKNNAAFEQEFVSLYEGIPLLGDLYSGFGQWWADLLPNNEFGKFVSTIVPAIPGIGALTGPGAYDKFQEKEIKEKYMREALGMKDEEITKEARDKIDLDVALDAIRNGTIEGSKRGKELARIYRDSTDLANENNLSKSAQKYYGNFMMANREHDMDAMKENWNKLTTDERNTMLNLYPGTESSLSTMAEKKEFSWMKEPQSAEDLSERNVADTEAYNQVLSDQAEILGTTSTALKLYAGALKNANKLTNDNTQETAEAAAESYKFNKAFSESRKAYTSNKDAINKYAKAMQNGEEVSYDVADATGEVVDQLKDMGIVLTSDDFKDAKTVENLNKLLKGTEEEAAAAYKALEAISTKNMLEEAFSGKLDTDKYKADIEGFASYLSNLEFDSNGMATLDSEWSGKLIDMVNKSKMTLEEAEKLFQEAHLEMPTPITHELEPETKDVPVPGYKTTHHYDGTMIIPNGGLFGGYKEEHVNYSWDEWQDDYQASYVTFDKNSTVKSSGGKKKNFTLPSNQGGKKSGGSKAKPSKKDPNKDELDRYQKVNVQLKEIGKQLNALEKQKKKLLGGDLVANLNKQIDILNKEIEVTEEKLKIAQGEQEEIAGKLSGYGVKFDNDGNISNYAQIFKREQDRLNAVYAQFNNMSKEAQEAYQDTVKAAEERFKTFKESITKYDTLIGDTIPQLYQDIQDAYDKQTEALIEQFNMEIKIRLDMAEATRDWNEFKRKVIDGIKDSDILGTTKAKIKDFFSYYNEEGTGEIQELTERVQAQLEEIRKQEEENGGEWYRDDEATAFEDLKEYYEKLKEGLVDIVALEEEIHQKFLDAMDEAQEKFDDQVDTFENINKQLDHNIELINLLTDQNDYERLAEQYAAQTKNRQEELDFYTQQKDFWANYLDTLEEGTDEWENAKAKYNEAADAWASALETTIQAARTEFENNINSIFKTINNQLTNNKGLDYLNEEWELLGDNSELVLDNINRMQGFQDITKKYNDAINSTSNIAAQKKLAQLRDDELESLKAMGSLSEKDLERAEKKLEIVKAQIALEDAQRNKSQMRLRRDSQGNYRYQFVADEDEIQQAQQDLYAAYNELYNFDKARYISNLNDAAQAWQEYQEKMAEAALINDPEVRAEKEALIKEKYDEKLGILHEQLQRTMADLNQSTFAELNALYGQNEQNYELMTKEQQEALGSFEQANNTAFELVFNKYTENTEKFHNMTQDQIDTIQNQMVPQWTSGYQALVDAIEGEGGIEEVSNRMMEEMQTAIDQYNLSLQETERVAGGTFDEITKAQNEVITRTTAMLKGNDELILQYQTMIDEMKKLYYGEGENNEGGLLGMMKAFKEEADKAKQAAIDAYNKIQEMNKSQADAAKNNTKEGSKADNEPKTSPTEPVVPQPSKASSSGPEVGKTVTFNSGKYTANSYGSGSSGSLYLGQQVKITRIVKDANGNVDTNRARPIHIASVNGGDLGWVALSQISGYASGGYTGEWGNSGRLAMLHQKELVLNKEDTANMLNAVEVLRSITDRIGADLLGRMASMTAGGFSSAVGGNAIDQNVHIEATFPGVQNAVEIETALNNLVNMAAQKAMQR